MASRNKNTRTNARSAKARNVGLSALEKNRRDRLKKLDRIRRSLAKLRRDRLTREAQKKPISQTAKKKTITPIAALPAINKNTPAKKIKTVAKTELATQSSKKRAREEKRRTCKERPDARKATRGSGGSRNFVPWCNRR